MSSSIKRLTPDDWEGFREIRLEALKLQPESFCPSQDESKFTEQDWRTRLSNPNGATFGLYRGNRLSRLFFEARINWAKECGDIHVLVLEHRDDNLLSERAHHKYGFVLKSSEAKKWPDGSSRPSLVFELAI